KYRIKWMLQKANVRPEEINAVLASLENPDQSFYWFMAFVKDYEKYLLGSGSALAVDVIDYLTNVEKKWNMADLVDEYLLHEVLEQCSSLHHRQIIDITSQFFNRQNSNPLKRALRFWIDSKVENSSNGKDRRDPKNFKSP